MERIEEIRNRVNTCEDDPCISLEEAEFLLSLIDTQRDGFKRISECGDTGEDARDMHRIAEEFI